MGMGIPYMGSKRKIASQLITYIANANPHAKHFYDLFGGGGAMSFAALESGFFDTVHYNELNTAVVNLLRKIQTDGVTDEFYQWISRERFFELIEGSDWLAGMAMTCWSFGNDQRSYLYGKDVEQEKKNLHDMIMSDYRQSGDVQASRRTVLAAVNGGRAQHAEQVAQLQSMARAQHLQALQVTNKSYSDVEVNSSDKETVIYCDIPYQGTKEYKHGGLDHDAFFEWCLNSPYKIYVSSYDAPMECAFELSHRSLLAAGDNRQRVIERLFCNRTEESNGMLF